LSPLLSVMEWEFISPNSHHRSVDGSKTRFFC